MVQLPVVLNAPDAQAVFTHLTAAACKLPKSHPRTMDQKHADLLVDAVLTGIPHDSLPKMQGHRPSIHVVVSADTLLDLDDNPGHLAGYGPITAETARRLAADQSGTWRRLLTEPDTGNLLDISADHYRPSQRLRDFVGARDDTCVFPGCNQPAYRCEFEHIISFGQGGKTCRQGGALACKRHNLCKVDTGWGYRPNPDGSWCWTDDTGHEFTSRPVPRWPMPDDEPPPSRPQPSPEEVHVREDREYEQLRSRWQHELDTALDEREAEQPDAGTRSAPGTLVDDMSIHGGSTDDSAAPGRSFENAFVDDRSVDGRSVHGTSEGGTSEAAPGLTAGRFTALQRAAPRRAARRSTAPRSTSRLPMARRSALHRLTAHGLPISGLPRRGRLWRRWPHSDGGSCGTEKTRMSRRSDATGPAG